MNRDARGLLLAVGAAFGAGLLAIAEHAEKVEQGYRLAAARAEGEVLRREAMHAERRVALLRLPRVAAERAMRMKLDLGHPSDRRTLSPEQVAALLVTPGAAGPEAHAPTAATPPGAGAPAGKPGAAPSAGVEPTAPSAPPAATGAAGLRSADPGRRVPPPARMPRPGEMAR